MSDGLRREHAADREARIALATCWGVLDALLTDDHLGDAARKRKLDSRTLKGDAYENGFEWARNEKEARLAMALRCAGVDDLEAEVGVEGSTPRRLVALMESLGYEFMGVSRSTPSSVCMVFDDEKIATLITYEDVNK